MDGSQRNRSQSVPILSQIEKILDREEDFGVERKTRDGYSRFPETRSSRRNITRAKVKLSSGGMIRKHKKRHSLADMENTPIGSPLDEQESEENEEFRPRAFTTSVIEVNTVNNWDPIPTGVKTSLDQVRDTEDFQPTVPARRRKRCKSLPSVIPVEYSQRELTVGNNKDKEIGLGALSPEQTATSEEFCREEKLFRRRSSLPARLQHGDSDEVSHGEKTDMTKSSTLDSTNLNKPDSLITEFDKLVKLKRSEQDVEEFFSDFARRRRSLPCNLEQGNVLTEPSVGNSNFDGDFRVDPALKRTLKTKTQRSQSLPLTSSRFVGEVRHPVKEECSNFSDNCGDGEYSFRQPLEHNEKSNKQSRHRKKSRKNRSKSLPLVLDAKAKANKSSNLTKHSKQRSLQSHDSLHHVIKEKTKRAKSLPFIYEGFSAKREVFSEAQIMPHSQAQTQSSDSDEKDRTVCDEPKHVYGNGNMKQKAQLERASSFPLRGPAAQHRPISDIREDLNKAMEVFFSQIVDKDHNVGIRERSKSLPTVLEETHSLNFAPIEKILEENRNIPKIVIAEENLYDTVGDEECESPILRGSLQSPLEEEKLTNEESNSDTGSDCDELQSQISHSTYVHDLPIVARQRGFSIPSSFKMEKIPEEPNEIENCETAISSCEHGGTESETNCDCKDRLNETIDCTAAIDDFIELPEERQASLEKQFVDHDEASLTQDQTEIKQEPNDYQQNLERFNKMVTESFSQNQQLEFAKSSSCLHRAAALGDLEYVKLLVEEGEDVNALDESGWPVLHAAVTTGHFDCCAWLIDAGADLEGYTNFVIDEYRMLCQQVYLYY